MIYDVTVVMYEPIVSQDSIAKVHAVMEELGFSQKVTTTDKRSLGLPADMYMGKFEGEGLRKVRDDLSASLKDKMSGSGLKNRFILLVSPPAAWSIRNT
ncbi:hypothetical protein [Pseudomonas sp. PNPG3]|uniref:hypothetical protein n=1 Tax=Pseudomonas sp. PNPG3 TaxID=2919497 RepID=UPI001FFCD5F5|nr:hypothetical protein [Pseudomonas sp. PNPG3]MCK2120817.1 hypothetical protein [Pseudomonas sp. PNPG3]